MKTYHDLLKKVLNEGQDRQDRTGTGTKSIFGHQIHLDLTQNFPLLTTKKIHLPAVIYELLWMIKGETNIKYLKEHGVRIWDEWADENGDLGPVYGKQWRSWETKTGETVDQLGNVINEIKTNPYSRRLLVNAWNPGIVNEMALPPCHVFFQFYVNVEEQSLSCQLYQRSADVFLGVPFNIASYSLLTCMIARLTGLKPKAFVHTFGDLHLYHNHIAQAKLQLEREPFALPTLEISGEQKIINDFRFEDFHFKDYQYHPAIKADVAI